VSSFISGGEGRITLSPRRGERSRTKGFSNTLERREEADLLHLLDRREKGRIEQLTSLRGEEDPILRFVHTL